jgi:hypothetical protein
MPLVQSPRRLKSGEGGEPDRACRDAVRMPDGAAISSLPSPLPRSLPETTNHLRCAPSGPPPVTSMLIEPARASPRQAVRNRSRDASIRARNSASSVATLISNARPKPH